MENKKVVRGGSIRNSCHSDRKRLLLEDAEALLRAGFEAITHPWVRDYVARGIGRGFELLPQLPDKDAEILHLLSALASPHCGQQGPMGNYLAWVASEVEQQIKLFG